MAHRFLNDPLYTLYSELLQLMDRGRFEEISVRIRELRKNEVLAEDQEALRRLISSRISIFKGQPPDEIRLSPASNARNPWIAGESAMVEGVHRFHQGKDLEGSLLFEEAARIFESIGMTDRQMIAAYNAVIGKVNGDFFPDLASQLDALGELEKTIRHHPDAASAFSALASVLRQKCYVYQEQGRLHAALHEVNESIPLFRDYGTQSDHHLALLQAADLAIDIHELLLARQYFERVVPPVEVRVEFPLALIAWRLGLSTKNPTSPPDPRGFEFVSPFWTDKLRRHTSNPVDAKGTGSTSGTEVSAVLFWNLESGNLHDAQTGTHYSIKVASLEGKLLRALMRGRSSKALLSEILWPEQYQVRAMDDRFHRLVSRINKKLGNVIAFDGQFYRLNQTIIITTDD